MSDYVSTIAQDPTAKADTETSRTTRARRRARTITGATGKASLTMFIVSTNAGFGWYLIGMSGRRVSGCGQRPRRNLSEEGEHVVGDGGGVVGDRDVVQAG